MQKRYKKELSLEKLAALPDEDIDFSDSPELDEAFWKNARPVMPEGKEKVSIRLDKDIWPGFARNKKEAIKAASMPSCAPMLRRNGRGKGGKLSCWKYVIYALHVF